MTDAGYEPSTLLVIGVDGGQTKTVTALATAEGDILASAVTGPCNHIHEPGGLERQYRTLRAGYEQVFANAGLPMRRLASVHLGLSGSGDRPTVERVYDTERLNLTSDPIIALSGAIPEMEGVIVIAGTGSAAFGRNAAGDEVITGGQGYYAGDEGGGSFIAQAAFRAIYQAADGRAPQTVMTERFLRHYGVDNLRALRNRIYGDLTRDQLAKAATLVGQAAAEGDGVAVSILRHAGHELGRLVVATLERLHWGDAPAPISPIGGVFRSGALVLEPMMETTHERFPQAYLQEARFEPVIGALLLALRALGRPIDEALLARLEATRHRIMYS
ncbi:MAG: BadF/BadG/BcrA/BcrD ATPase family protein [Chloroflexota bacterium]|nr:MAG: hypothetical protein DIU68_14345 [Chloroflexota bacterium]